MTDLKLKGDSVKFDFGLTPEPVTVDTYALLFVGGAHVDFGNVLNMGAADFRLTFRAKPRVLNVVQPLISKAAADQYLHLPGTPSTSVASTPDAPANSVTGDIDLRAKLAMNDWTPAANALVLMKYPAAPQRSYLLGVASAGGILLMWSPDGTTQVTHASGVLGLADGSTKWIRATLDVNNGAGGYDVKFWTSDDGVAWTQVGATQVGGAPTSIFDGNGSLVLGGQAGNMVEGKAFHAEVRNGIDGPVVAKFDANAALPGSTSLTSGTGEVWTIGGSAAIRPPLGSWQLLWDASGNLRLHMGDTGGGFVAATLAAAASWTAGVEAEIEVTLTRSGNAVCKKDGVQVGTLAISAAAGSLDNAAALQFGKMLNGGYTYDGNLDTVTIHKTTFDDAGLSGRWDFDEGAGTAVHDSSGKGFTGTLVSGVVFLLTGTKTLAAAYDGLETDDGLETAVRISLFTERRAAAGDELPTGDGDRRGWWGDAVPVVEGDLVGSRLWLLARAKQLPENVARAEEYTREALQWLLDDKVASEVEVSASIPRAGMLGLEVVIHRPTGDQVNFRFDYTWAAQEGST